MDSTKQLIYIIAGEVSGDIHAAELMQSYREINDNVVFSGLGGARMLAHAQATGGDLEDWLESAAVMGLVEVLKHYNYFKEQFYKLLNRIERDQPDALILVDYPGFNLRIAKQVKKRWPHIKIIQYVSPQVWAWKAGRIKTMQRDLDLLLCLFDFELKYFEDTALDARCYGHPLVDELEEKRDKSIVRDESLVALLPGSREREVNYLLPKMLGAAKLLLQKQPDLRFEIPLAQDKLKPMIEAIIQEHGLGKQVTFTKSTSQQLMQQAHTGIIASGTATLEAAYYGLVFCLVYQLAPLTHWLADKLVKIDDVGLINIIAGRQIIPEFIQHEFRAENVAAKIQQWYDYPKAYQALQKDLLEEVKVLGKTRVQKRLASSINEYLLKST